MNVDEVAFPKGSIDSRLSRKAKALSIAFGGSNGSRLRLVAMMQIARLLCILWIPPTWRARWKVLMINPTGVLPITARRSLPSLRASICLFSLILFPPVHLSFASPAQFQTLYDHYFPRNDRYQNGEYRRWFDRTLFGSPPQAGTERHPVYYAFRGEPIAFHAFVHHPDRDGEGEFTLTWNRECLVLLLGLGDERFSKLLGREDEHTREAVGAVIDCQVDWRKHQFPKTRALYSYRYIRPSHQALQKKYGNGVSDFMGLLAREKRFSGVRVYNTSDENGRILVTVPRTLSEKDTADLQGIMHRCVGNDASLVAK